jgi:hypothetical protein
MIRTNNHPQISQIVADEEGIDIRSSLRPLRNLCALCVKKLTNSDRAFDREHSDKTLQSGCK